MLRLRVVRYVCGDWGEGRGTVCGPLDADAACGYAAVLCALGWHLLLTGFEAGFCGERNGSGHGGEQRDAANDGEGDHDGLAIVLVGDQASDADRVNE